MLRASNVGQMYAKASMVRVSAIASVLALWSCSSFGAGPPLREVSRDTAGSTSAQQHQLAALAAGTRLHHVCAPAKGLRFACNAIVTDAVPISLNAVPNSSCLHLPGCYAPADLQSAYGLTQASATAGTGMTVAIVDAHGYKDVASDLAVYRRFFKLPPCGKGCFTVLNQNGHTSPLPKPDPRDDWQPEIAIDVDMVSAICPNCKIVLVEAKSSFLSDLRKAEAVALRRGNVVNDSWGGVEYAASDALFDTHPGKVIVTSSGDSGAGIQQPCAFAGVVCTGGTRLVFERGRRVSETVWDGLTKNTCGAAPCATGSGCSAKVAKPSWQNDRGCAMRSETDVSADADPYTGIVIACTPCGSNGPLLGGAGGTSAAAPMIAAMFALAGDLNTAGPQELWMHGGSTAFHDVVKGNNESALVGTFLCPKTYSYICNARAGYDGPTGWGTPNGLTAFTTP